jgi:DNA-binding NtrC family response regulator
MGGTVAATVEILILDDEPIVGDRLKPALEKCGYHVEALTDSQDAIERLTHKRYDLLIMDLKMSGPSGLDVLRYVKEQSPTTGVIVITGYATAEQATESLKSGAIDFIAKPFRISEITKLVSRVLSKGKASSGPQTV